MRSKTGKPIAIASVALVAAAASAFAATTIFTNTYRTTNPASIPQDGGTSGIELMTLNVKQRGRIKDVDVKLRGAADRIGSARMVLLPPTGPEIDVFRIDAVNVQEQIGTGQAGCDGQPIRLSDGASRQLVSETDDATGTYSPPERLSKLNRRPATGKWRLQLIAEETTNGGGVNCFELRIKTRKRSR